MTVNRKYALYREMWQTIKDCLEVEPIKRKTTQYLPMPSDDEDMDRYKTYLSRAVFYAVTRKTLGGLMGSAFNSPVIFDGVSDELLSNINSQESFDSFVKRAMQNVIAYGRCLIVPDFAEGKAVLHLYDALEVTDWKTSLGRVIGLSISTMIDDVDVEIEHKIINGEWVVTANGLSTVMSAEGKTFDYIPCTFIGSTNNYHHINYPYLYDIAALNIAHYRNSADYEESCFVSGQPTIVATGLTTDWVDNVLGGSFRIGSRGGIPLPSGADAKVLQIPAQSALMEAMTKKEEQMIALGAKLIEPNTSSNKTATEASNQAGEQINLLALMGRNVEEGIKQALSYARMFDPSNIADNASVKITGDYGKGRFNKDVVTTVQALWLNKAITFDEMRASLGGVAIHEADEARKMIDSETGGGQWITT